MSKPVEEYEEKDVRTHIYETTDTMGQDQIINGNLSIMKGDSKKIETTDVSFDHIIYKMFDEIIVNVAINENG